MTKNDKLLREVCAKVMLAPIATFIFALAIPAVAGAEREDPQLDLWYDLEKITDHSATYGTVDSYKGDFHLVVLPQGKTESRQLTLRPGTPKGVWENTPELVLEAWIKAESPTNLRAIRLFDTSGKVYEMDVSMDIASSAWVLRKIPLNPSSSGSAGVPSRLSSIELLFDAGAGAIGLDDLKLQNGSGNSIHITDKPLRQRVAETATSKKNRLDSAFAAAARRSSEPTPQVRQKSELFGRLWVADSASDLRSVNQDLYNIFSSPGSKEWGQFGLNGRWNLSVTHYLLRCYHTFSSRAQGERAGRLEKATEDALLAVLWDRTIDENDIYITQHSTFAMDGSENHDLDSKVASLLASKIFMEHPEWSEKVLPNAGRGSGSGYWFHRDGETNVYGPEGLANKRGEDAKDYVARDHYTAWVEYFRRYIHDRGKSGFFLEKASGHYMTYTMGYLFDLYTWGGDAALKQAMGNLLDVVWVEWAIDQMHGVKGGAKTRYRFQPYSSPAGLRDSFSEIGQFFFGGAGNAQPNHFSTMLSDYEMPLIVWQLAFDRKRLGSFAYASRELGESVADYVGEPGLERTVVCNSTSRLIRYSWITPDYILGTQMDHPGVTHNHLSVSGRFQGLFFAEPRGAAVYVKGIENDQEFTTPAVRYPYNNTMVRSVQHEQVAIFQGARRVLRQSPAWFPNESHQLEGMVVGFTKIQQVEEEKGWIFVQNGGGLLALRVVDGLQKPMTSGGNAANRGMVDLPLESEYVDLVEKGYSWNTTKDKIRFEDPWSPVIFEAGRLEDFGSLGEFKKYILGNKVTLLKTVVPGFYKLHYHFGKNHENHIEFNAANLQIPRVNGKPVDYDPSWLFSSPYLNSEYQTGVITYGLPEDQQTKRL